MSARLFLWVASCGFVGASCLAYGLLIDRFNLPSVFRVVYFPMVALGGLSMYVCGPAQSRWREIVLYLWIPAIAFRLLLLPAAHSDDLNRYLWEGNLLANGISPYATTADDPQLAEYIDAYWEQMNHKDKPTAYPPLALAVFAVVTSIAYSPLAFKLVFVAADLAIIAFLVLILRGRGLNPFFAVFYAFNPIALITYAGEGHFDSLMIAPLVVALWLYDQERPRLACAIATLGAGIKWMTLPLVPFLGGKRLFSSGVVAVCCLCLPFLLIGDALEGLLGLAEFGGTRSFNGPIYDLLVIELGLSRTLANGAVILAFGVILFWRWLIREQATVDSHFRWVLGALLVFAPTVHFWYLAWLLPFVCLSPKPAWLVLSGSAGAYFYVWMNADAGEGWGLQGWQRLLFWGPFFVTLAYEFWICRGSCLFPRIRPKNGERIAVVIPTLNAERSIEDALQSVAAQSTPVDEVIVVDANSEDATCAIVQRNVLEPVILKSEPGRGLQIAEGVAAAASDWVVVLHADAILAPDSVARLKKAIRSHPEMVAGAFGQRFDGAGWSLTVIELLNELRVLFSKTAFGDQVQFFNRETALERSLIPRQPLMEDVESSWRAREYGEFVYLGCVCSVSRAKWRSGRWLERVGLVLSLMVRYRFARFRGREHAAELSNALYRQYYKRPS